MSGSQVATQSAARARYSNAEPSAMRTTPSRSMSTSTRRSRTSFVWMDEVFSEGVGIRWLPPVQAPPERQRQRRVWPAHDCRQAHPLGQHPFGATLSAGVDRHGGSMSIPTAQRCAQSLQTQSVNRRDMLSDKTVCGLGNNRSAVFSGRSACSYNQKFFWRGVCCNLSWNRMPT